ncbi:hypothetical protein N0V88_002093 [Collariella sp. IMI 366227]|nr:hypothetical protein N0V88_002093 [Collariella sp. IMI 366227]
MVFARMNPTRLTRGLPSLVFHSGARAFYSTKTSAFPASSKSKIARNILLASVTGASGVWFLDLAKGYRDQVPHLDGPATGHLAFKPGPSEHDVSRIVSQGAYSCGVRNIPGVFRYDGTQLASNYPVEDRFMHGKFPSPREDGTSWMAWAVFDGHVGWQTADLLEKQLLPFVRFQLEQVKTWLKGDDQSVMDVVHDAVKKAFINLDDNILQAGENVSQSTEPLQDKIKKLLPAFAGSCALLTLYDPQTNLLHVACTGDSRAVLGEQRPDGTWKAIPLSIDQTGRNPDEAARLKEEHPGEDGIIKDGRVLGLGVSRAFGDSRWKWPTDLQEELRKRFYGPSHLATRYPISTPPYLTAKPDVISFKIDQPCFLIMATDGMWDNLSNQHAVDLVGKWLEAGMRGKASRESRPVYEAFDFSHFKRKYWVDRRFVEERATVVDENAAVHLVRNSLGGNHHEMIAGRLAYDEPFSRRIRDDITVQVIFFGEKGA